MGALSSASRVRKVWTAEISRRKSASWRADRDSDQSRGGATSSSAPKTSKPPGDAQAGRATLASRTSILLVTPPRPPDDPHPVGLWLACPGLTPGLWHPQATGVSSDPIEIFLVDHVLCSHSLSTKLAGTNPAANGFRVPTDPVSGVRDGQHRRCMLLHFPRSAQPARARWSREPGWSSVKRYRRSTATVSAAVPSDRFFRDILDAVPRSVTQPTSPDR